MNKTFLSYVKKKSFWEGVVWLILLVIIIKLFVLKSIGIILNLPFPSHTDQDGYLTAGQEFVNSGLFLARAPLYSLWMGLMYSLSGNDIAALYYNEKIASVFLMSLLMLILGWKFFDKWTALFFFLWIWNCKYLITEPNGSHTLAAVFLILALIFVSLKNKFFHSFFVLMLFFSALCRSEMWIVILIFSTISILYYLLKAKNKKTFKENFKIEHFSGFIIICSACIILLFYFKSNKFNPEPGRLSIAFCQNFSVNYVERNNLFAKYPNPWSDWIIIWKESVPKANSPADVLKFYPKELIKHLFYNIKLSVKAIPATVFGLIDKFSFMIAMCCWLTSFYFFRRNFSIFNTLTISLLLSTFVLIITSFIFKVAMRYYEQLIPVLMILFVFMSIHILGAIQLYLRKKNAMS